MRAAHAAHSTFGAISGLAALSVSVWLAASGAPAAAVEGQRCHLDVPCALGDRSYHVREPDGWDGQSPLPVLLHFHGWARQGDLVVRHRRIAGATRRRGVLLVAPNGDYGTWRFRTADSPDTDFAAQALADVRRRYPVDDSRIFVSGYSYGSSMAWRYACERGSEVAALLAISGALGQGERCPEAPREARHVHGFDDTVLRYPLGPGGDETHAVALWRSAMGCGAGRRTGPWRQVSWLELDRTAWDCPGGRVILDTHPGGHFIPHGWIARQLDELLGLPPAYP